MYTPVLNRTHVLVYKAGYAGVPDRLRRVTRKLGYNDPKSFSSLPQLAHYLETLNSRRDEAYIFLAEEGKIRKSSASCRILLEVNPSFTSMNEDYFEPILRRTPTERLNHPSFMATILHLMLAALFIAGLGYIGVDYHWGAAVISAVIWFFLARAHRVLGLLGQIGVVALAAYFFFS